MVSTAQHLTDLATALASRGHDVTVVASDRGYDDPTARFARREQWNGIEIIRIRTLSLGKGAKWRRAFNFGSFLLICALRLLLLPRFDVVVALTSPPLISFLATLFVKLKGGSLCSWVMDLNPDEAIAAGWLDERFTDNSFSATTLELQLSQRRTHDRARSFHERTRRCQRGRSGSNRDHSAMVARRSTSAIQKREGKRFAGNTICQTSLS